MLKREWIGRYVRLKRRVTTRGGKIFEEGKVLLVNRNFGGLNLSAPSVCQHCGLGDEHFVTKVPERDVVLLPEDFSPPQETPTHD